MKERLLSQQELDEISQRLRNEGILKKGAILEAYHDPTETEQSSVELGPSESEDEISEAESNTSDSVPPIAIPKREKQPPKRRRGSWDANESPQSDTESNDTSPIQSESGPESNGSASDKSSGSPTPSPPISPKREVRKLVRRTGVTIVTEDGEDVQVANDFMINDDGIRDPFDDEVTPVSGSTASTKTRLLQDWMSPSLDIHQKALPTHPGVAIVG